MAYQSQTFANSGYAYYGNPADWSNYSTLTSTISFNDTNAKLKVIPAVPDSNTTIEFNNNQLAYVSDIPDLANWAQYPANHNVDIPAPYVLNVSTANVSTLVSKTASISTLTVSTLNYTFPPIGNISTLLGPTIGITADQGLFTLSPSAVEISTVNGSFGKISLTANPGQLATLGGQINVTANGGNSVGGLYGAVNIVANAGRDVTTDIFTGGKINITANSETALGSLTSALNLNSGGINSYAGFGTPIASLFGYNFINGTAGVSLCASVVPNSAFQVPGTCYLYGDSGITLGSDTYGTRLFPYWNGLVAPPNLQISGRTTIAGSAYVVLNNVSTLSFEAGQAGAITGVQTINGSVYPPPAASVPPDLNLSTITMNPTTGIIRANDIVNPNTNGNDLSITQEGTGSLSISVNPSAGPQIGEIRIAGSGTLSFNEIVSASGLQINSAGDTLTFLQSAVPADQGMIVGLSTINGVAYPPINPGFVDSFQIYVAPNGNNTTGTGSQQAPFLTIARAITARATISTTVETVIMISAGTYTESFTLLRNTYLVGVQTGESRQPCNVVGTITMNDTTGNMGISGLEVVGNVSMLGLGGVYTVFGCNISSSGTAVTATTGTVFITESRISNTSGSCLTCASTIVIRDCVIATSGTGACVVASAATTIRQTVLQSTSASTGVQPLLNITNSNPATQFLGFNRYEYTSAVTDVTGNKCCIKFAGSGVATASIYQSLLICEGAITGSPQIQCIQDTGAGTVNLSYGGLLGAGPAHHISPNVTKTAFTPVP